MNSFTSIKDTVATMKSECRFGKVKSTKRFSNRWNLLECMHDQKKNHQSKTSEIKEKGSPIRNFYLDRILLELILAEKFNGSAFLHCMKLPKSLNTALWICCP